MAGQVICTEHLRISALHNRARNSEEEVTRRKKKRSFKKKQREKKAAVRELQETMQELKILMNYHA